MPSCLVLETFVQFSDPSLVSFFSPKHWLSGVGLLLIGATTLYGQDSWQGPVGANGDWFTGTNWTNGVPMTGVDATVNNGGTAQIPRGTATVGTLTIGDSVAGSTVQLIGGDLNATSVIIGPQGTFEFSGGLLSVSSSFVDDGGTVLFNTAPVQHLSLLSGFGQVIIQGIALTLTGDVTFSGETIISTGGSLQFGTGGTVGSISGNISNNGTVIFDRSDVLTFAGTISGTGNVTQIGTGTTILTGNDTYTGGTTISAGTLQLGNGGTTGSITGNVIDNGTLAFDRSNTLTLAGSITGAGVVVQAGTGTTVLTGSNTYTGGTTISAGTLQIGDGGTTGNIAGNVTDNGVLVFDRSDSVTFAGLISGKGKVEQIGTGTTVLIADNTYSGGTTISAGTLQLGNGGTSGSITGNVIDNGALAFDRSDVFTFGGLISGTGSVQQIGMGTFVLTADNTYTGETIISAGTLQLGTGGTVGGIVGNVINNGILLFDRSNAFTVPGTISGRGRVEQIGTGTTVLIADNTYSGGTTINAGTLQLGNGGTTGSIVGNVTDSGTLAFDRSDILTFSGLISGTGGVEQIGTGSTVLTAANTYTGQTTVDDGSLIVDGSIASPETVVNPGGTLAGTGLIGGNVVNNGIVSPGDPTGTLTISGNYAQNSSGTLRIGVSGTAPGQFGVLAVNGHATLGGTLQLVSINGFLLAVGNKLTFLTAVGGVSGTFSSIQNPFMSNTAVEAEFIVLPDAVVVEGTQGSFVSILQSLGPIVTSNELAVAKALDSARGDPREAALFAFLNSQPIANLPHDLSLIAPTQISSINAAVSVGKVQTSNIGQRMANIHAGSTGFSSSGFTLNGDVPAFGNGLAGETGAEGKSGPSVLAPIPENRWGFFVTGLGEFTNVDSTPNANGYDVNTGGITLGVDYRVTPYFAVGLLGGYAHNNVSLVGGGNIDVNGGTFGAYSTLFGNGFYLDAAITGGPNGYDTHRTALQGSANGSTEGADLNVVVSAGYDWKYGNLSIGPTASFGFGYVDLDAFSETGSLAPLKFPDQNTESETTAFGAKAMYEWKIGKVTLIPQVSAAWQHEYGSVAYQVIAGFASGAGTNFTVNGPEIGRDSLLIGAGVSIIWSDRFSTYVFYDGDVARTNYDSHTVTGGVRITF
jgi:autotransporter-associated beta strand protein